MLFFFKALQKNKTEKKQKPLLLSTQIRTQVRMMVSLKNILANPCSRNSTSLCQFQIQPDKVLMCEGYLCTFPPTSHRTSVQHKGNQPYMTLLCVILSDNEDAVYTVHLPPSQSYPHRAEVFINQCRLQYWRTAVIKSHVWYKIQ